MAAYRIRYSGHVQGVGFRYSVKQIAAEFEVSGTVENLPDGDVELFLQGEEAEASGMLEAIRESHLNGFIRKEDIRKDIERTEIAGFSIRV
jgi:acylphosphatase